MTSSSLTATELLQLLRQRSSPECLELLQFMRSQVCHENILFYWSVEDYKLLHDSLVHTPDTLLALSNDIANTFVASGSSLEVNLDEFTRTTVLREISIQTEAGYNTFDSAQFQAFRMMLMDCVPRYTSHKRRQAAALRKRSQSVDGFDRRYNSGRGSPEPGDNSRQSHIFRPESLSSIAANCARCQEVILSRGHQCSECHMYVHASCARELDVSGVVCAGSLGMGRGWGAYERQPLPTTATSKAATLLGSFPADLPRAVPEKAAALLMARRTDHTVSTRPIVSGPGKVRSMSVPMASVGLLASLGHSDSLQAPKEKDGAGSCELDDCMRPDMDSSKRRRRMFGRDRPALPPQEVSDESGSGSDSNQCTSADSKGEGTRRRSIGGGASWLLGSFLPHKKRNPSLPVAPSVPPPELHPRRRPSLGDSEGSLPLPGREGRLVFSTIHAMTPPERRRNPGRLGFMRRTQSLSSLGAPRFCPWNMSRLEADLSSMDVLDLDDSMPSHVAAKAAQLLGCFPTQLPATTPNKAAQLLGGYSTVVPPTAPVKAALLLGRPRDHCKGNEHPLPVSALEVSSPPV